MTAALAATALLTGGATAWAALTPEGSPYVTGGSAPYNVNVADFNGDGRSDVLAVNGDSGTLSVFLRQPGGGFAQEASCRWRCARTRAYPSVPKPLHVT